MKKEELKKFSKIIIASIIFILILIFLSYSFTNSKKQLKTNESGLASLFGNFNPLKWFLHLTEAVYNNENDDYGCGYGYGYGHNCTSDKDCKKCLSCQSRELKNPALSLEIKDSSETKTIELEIVKGEIDPVLLNIKNTLNTNVGAYFYWESKQKISIVFSHINMLFNPNEQRATNLYVFNAKETGTFEEKLTIYYKKESEKALDYKDIGNTGVKSFDVIFKVKVVEQEKKCLPDPSQNRDVFELNGKQLTCENGKCISCKVECPKSPQETRANAYKSSVKISVADAIGNSVGSGTIIDSRSDSKSRSWALIVTAGHLFRDSQGKGKITVELSDSDGNKKTVLGFLRFYNLNRDIALVSVYLENIKVKTSKVAPKYYNYNKGDKIFDIGVDNGKWPPRIIEGEITMINEIENDIEVSGGSVEGRSGGGLFSDCGYVIGVITCNDPSCNAGIASGLPKIHWALDKKGLSYVYKGTESDNVEPSNTKPKICPAINKESCPTPAPTEENCRQQIKTICGDLQQIIKTKCTGKERMVWWRTRNFNANSQNGYACIFGETAEYWRCKNAVEFLGYKLPDWNPSSNVPMNVHMDNNLGPGGATSFSFYLGKPFGWIMNVQGPYNRLLDSVIPHEILHTIMATYFGKPLPRWIDEGMCSQIEDISEKQKLYNKLILFLKTGRGIPTDNLLTITKYPRDVLPLYAQGSSVVKFLIEKGGGGCKGKRKIVQFLKNAWETSYPNALKKYYGYNTGIIVDPTGVRSDRSFTELQNEWLNWIKKGCGDEYYKVPVQQQTAPNPIPPASLSKPQIVVKVFGTDWCHFCKELDKVIWGEYDTYGRKIKQGVADKITNIKFIKINPDKNISEKNKYRIGAVPVLVYEKNGREVKRTIGSQQESKIISDINQVKQN